MKQVPIKNYLFSVHDPQKTLPKYGGVYIFAHYSHNCFETIYIGETECFFDRLSPNQHEKWEEAIRSDLTHILLYKMDNEGERKRIERELIKSYPPFLANVINDHASLLGITPIPFELRKLFMRVKTLLRRVRLVFQQVANRCEHQLTQPILNSRQ